MGTRFLAAGCVEWLGIFGPAPVEYELYVAPPPPEEPPLKPPKLPPDEPLLDPPPLLNPEDLVLLGILTIFLSWKLQYLHVLSTSFLPVLV